LHKFKIDFVASLLPCSSRPTFAD